MAKVCIKSEKLTTFSGIYSTCTVEYLYYAIYQNSIIFLFKYQAILL